MDRTVIRGGRGRTKNRSKFPNKWCERWRHNEQAREWNSQVRRKPTFLLTLSYILVSLFKGSTRPCYMETTVSCTLSDEPEFAESLLGIPWLYDTQRFVVPASLIVEIGLKGVKETNAWRTWGTWFILPPKRKTIPLRRMCCWIPRTPKEISTAGKLCAHSMTAFGLLTILTDLI